MSIALMEIDQVRIVGPAGWQRITLDAFFEMPLSDRIRHVLQRTVEFKRGRVVIPPQEVMAAYRRLKAVAA